MALSGLPRNKKQESCKSSFTTKRTVIVSYFVVNHDETHCVSYLLQIHIPRHYSAFSVNWQQKRKYVVTVVLRRAAECAL